MNTAHVRLILEALKLAKKFGTDYMESKIQNSGKIMITQEDLDELVRDDPNPEDVFENK